ncbi:urea ABC transporter permease subunit UrtB [Litoreibacter janthinus]|uniref:Amino acid/amide ABC transporter membrane protein 1, HAAT family n=1 Tax=Litoreibacter janthinus TaxID=670154 RepID=A0A1I6HSN7_9RHOB|nr:urea ABC transporter permease subunit UrtB [Litoreibacter janthinus]SFR57444.1 amino acid/amide ABC transporter membrane protein 1, HAAT family [Litoreibacter janthinus]
MRIFLLAIFAIGLSVQLSVAQGLTIQNVLQEHRDLIEKSSRKTIEPAIKALADSGLEQAQNVLQKWQSKEMWQRKDDGQFFYGEEVENKQVRLFRFEDATLVGNVDKSDLSQLKPNSGIRAMIGEALVQFQLSDLDPVRRREALLAIQRDPAASQLAPLRASIATEPDAEIKAHKERLNQLLTIGYDRDEATRIEAIEAASGAISLELRGTLNPLVETRRMVVAGSPPDNLNIARVLIPGNDELSQDDAYRLLVEAGLAEPVVTNSDIASALSANVEGGRVGGAAIAQLDTLERRAGAYDALAQAGTVPARVTDEQIEAALAAHSFLDVFADPSPAVTTAATKALRAIETNVAINQTFDLALDALSLASIFFLAAIGLAITFGVMGVINMAHGEFIMMGAYTGYVVQQLIPNYTVSILVGLPMAFAVTFAAGVAMERLVIRHLYNRPLETLLATFGISIALQQIAKNVFGTQARPLTSPAWLDGAWVLNDVVSISYIRIAIFGLALIFLAIFLFIMKRTRLGLETRAVTQNPRMAASMGINPDRVNMLTFGLGSGIAGVAGVAIGLFAKVTSELGSDYIVQSFMTVVVGGVGNIWGTLAGATMIGFLQKGIEWGNPSNTLAAQTYMIVFIIIFIQFRPRGIIALKGRAAGD